jgi:UPF0176 acylphosphatase like domain
VVGALEHLNRSPPTPNLWLHAAVVSRVQMLSAHRAFLMGREIVGRIYINGQGINAQLSGPRDQATAYATWVEQLPEFRVRHAELVCGRCRHQRLEHVSPAPVSTADVSWKGPAAPSRTLNGQERGKERSRALVAPSGALGKGRRRTSHGAGAHAARRACGGQPTQ